MTASVDLDLFYGNFIFAPLCVEWEHTLTADFLETIDVFDLKVGT